MYGFFYMSRYNLPAVQQAMKEAFGWSQHAVLAGRRRRACSSTGSSVFLNGPLADKIGGKRAILIGSAGAALLQPAVRLLATCILKHAATVKGAVVVAPAVFAARHDTPRRWCRRCAVLWGCNHYFQSFGALSIVKINAAWFHVRERGSFAGIFGIMIQSGRLFAFYGSPLILALPAVAVGFWIPAAILVVMFFVNFVFVADSPADAGYEFHTADETKEEAAQQADARLRAAQGVRVAARCG